MAAGRHVAARWIHPRLIVALTSIERSGPHSPLFYFYREAIEPVRVSARTGFILPFIRVDPWLVFSCSAAQNSMLHALCPLALDMTS